MISVEMRVSVAAPVVLKGEQLVPIPPKPAGKDVAPVLTHHSYAATPAPPLVGGFAPKPPVAV